VSFVQQWIRTIAWDRIWELSKMSRNGCFVRIEECDRSKNIYPSRTKIIGVFDAVAAGSGPGPGFRRHWQETPLPIVVSLP